jgi:hypothetical protein
MIIGGGEIWDSLISNIMKGADSRVAAASSDINSTRGTIEVTK